ncbi:MAG: lipopolysaccharide heptosyltransferase II [SAR324 cluster bacterium]|nr:lipopolysaccharide heptosyltransferase II [SAR324 cluster bacterium]
MEPSSYSNQILHSVKKSLGLEASKPPPAKIIIRTPNWLGDLMMSTAFIRAVLDTYPRARVDLIVRAGFDSLPLPQRGQIIPFDRKRHALGMFGEEFKDKGYDRFYVLPPSFSSAWMAYHSGIPERIGYSGQMRGWLLHPAKRYAHHPRTTHLIQEYLALLGESFSMAQYRPNLDMTEAWIESQLAPFKQTLPERFITVAMGAIFGPSKQWPVEYYRELVHDICENLKIPVVLLGTPQEHVYGESVRSSHPLVINWCGKTNMAELVAVLSRSELLISNDSGTMHVMSALRRPQIAIFGSTSTVWTGPVNPYAEVLHLHLACSPCFKKKCRFGHYNCLKQILPHEVFNQVFLLLQRIEMEHSSELQGLLYPRADETMAALEHPGVFEAAPGVTKK